MIKLHTLGGARLTDAAGAELHSVLSQPKRFALLVYLALAAPGQFERRDPLLALFWPESDEERARASLRTTLHFLRRSLGKGVIETRGMDEVGLAPRALWCDALAFADAVQAGHWAEALELYRGPLLPGFALEDTPAWEEWLEAERERLGRLHAKALQALAEEREVAGDPVAAAELWRRLAVQDPFSARVALRLMGALEAAGERAAAIQHAAAHAETLREQLGVEPDPQVTALAEVLRAVPAPPPPAAHEGRQASPAPPRPAASAPAAASAAPPPELPLPPTPLIGREAELTSVLGTLMRESVLLLTLTGSGGIGKTRLALAAAREAQSHFADGAYFVDLARISDPALVLPTVADVLGVKESGATPLRDVLRDHLAKRAVLLVLDNFEHLLGASSDIPALLGAAPRLKVLTTSREPLRLRAEHEHPVPPLARYPAIELFAARARAVRPDFELTETNAAAVAGICTRLDGLPLAIELAAARIKLLPPAQILARLEHSLALLTGGARDLPPRHQTLRAAIGWSHELLCDGEKRLFHRLAVFAGGCRLGAAEALCGEELGAEVLDGLSSLLDKSLLVRRESVGEEPRFAMLETIHEYARERLAESGEAEAIRRRHAEFFLQLAEEARTEMLGPRQAHWVRRLEDEHDNLRAALRWSLDAGAADAALRTAAALAPFWYMRRYVSEGRQWLGEALSMGASSPPLVRAQALYGAGRLASRQDDAAAQLLVQESLEIFRSQGEREWAPRALNMLGTIAVHQGDLERAEALYQETLRLHRETGSQRGIAGALGNLGEIARFRRDYEQAKAFYEEDLALVLELGDPFLIDTARSNLGLAALHLGDLHRAARLFRECLQANLKTGSKFDIGWDMAALAAVAGAEGQPIRAGRLFGAGETLFAELGSRVDPFDRDWYDRYLAAARAQLDEQVWQHAWAEGQAMSLEQAISYALEGEPPDS
ncbi:BTAD domain-containing putative transcriptional regulator [soil metagenome]